jgi:hypothetical protein
MPLDQPITPGTVDWTGENPGIVLKNKDGSNASMALFFRVAWSPVGQGHMLLLYGSPGERTSKTKAPNVILTDNMALASFLKKNFVSRLPSFNIDPELESLPVRLAQSVRSSGDAMGHRYCETISGEGLVVDLVWEQLEKPIALELSPDQVGTRAHTMFTILVPSRSAQIIVNGYRLPGDVGERVQAGMKTTSAFLYFSETWIIPPEAA